VRRDLRDETDTFVADNYVELKARKVLAAGVPAGRVALGLPFDE
jgi:hypothetical protein